MIYKNEGIGFNQPVLMLRTIFYIYLFPNRLLKMYQNYIKRTLDLIIAFVTFICLSPLIALLLVLSWVNLRSIPVYVQVRVGRNEKPFMLYKIKTMRDKSLDGIILSDEQRITKLGRFLRMSSFDESLQLINVMAGHLSLVGPKPLFLRYISHYTQQERLRHSVRPGMTGLAQVVGKKCLKKGVPTPWNKLLQLDITYVRNCCFLLDLMIVAKTFFTVVTLKNVPVVAEELENWLDEERGA